MVITSLRHSKQSMIWILAAVKNLGLKIFKELIYILYAHCITVFSYKYITFENFSFLTYLLLYKCTVTFVVYS